MTDQKNTLLAIVLSALVLIAWQYFVGMPQMEKQRQEAQLKQQQQQQQQVQQPGQPAGAGAADRAARTSGRRRRNCPAKARASDARRCSVTREAVLARLAARPDRHAAAARLDRAARARRSTTSR